MESRNFWINIKREIPIWRRGAIPGLTILGLMILARLTGLLQPLEWTTLDAFLRLRPSELIDEQITIVGIDENDIQRVGKYPTPDQEIARLIKILHKYQPIVIGLDNIRDIPVDVGYEELVEVFKNSKNLIGIEKVLIPKIQPPPHLPPEQIGFSDAIPDKDGQYRRSLLAIPTPQGDKFSLSFRLAEAYLLSQGIILEQGIHNPDTMRFKSTELPLFFANTGGYVNTNAGGIQILLNYRNNSTSFRILSLNDIKTGNFQPSWLQNRIILIGIMAPSTPDLINTSAINGLKPHRQMYGVEFQAHAISQIINAVLKGRPLLKTWSDGWEYLWILAWGILSIIISRLTQSAMQNFLAIGITSILLMIIGYLFIIWGWWLPIAPTLLILAINGLGASAFYEYEEFLRLQVEERQHAIKEAFDDIHNGPLQELAHLSRIIQAQDSSHKNLLSQLQKINQDIREIFDNLLEKTVSQKNNFRIGSGLNIDLNLPLHTLFYEVYWQTVKRNLLYFQSLKISIVEFVPIDSEIITTEQKRLFCQFLEEALCNVGKHASGVTKVEVIGEKKDSWYILSIQDNGVGLTSSQENQGTKNAKELAKKIGGKFQRKSVNPSGVLCQLTWPVSTKKRIWFT